MSWKSILITLCIASSSAFAKTNSVDSLSIEDTQSISQKNELELSFEEKNSKVLLNIAEQISSEEYFKLYPTTNMWTFLKLDTRNGRIWQVQYSTKGDDYRFQTYINENDLTYNNGKSSRFELYPTQNMYNFIMLDKSNGRVWQVQWSMEKKDRVIIRIY